MFGGNLTRVRGLQVPLTATLEAVLKPSYPGLNALRGVAALMVLSLHACTMTAAAFHVTLVPGRAMHAYLAVDFFYMLSGFVIATAYGGRLAAGWSFRDFIITRLKRLYPLHALGMVLGAVTTAMLIVSERTPISESAPTLAALTTLGLLFLPFLTNSGAAFPLNGVAWSLSQEMIANVIYGLFAKHLTTTALTVAVALGLAGCIVTALVAGNLDQGFRGVATFLGLPRLVYGFSVGLLIRQLHLRGLTRRFVAIHPRMTVVALVLALGVPDGFVDPGLYDVLCDAFVLPFILICGVEGRAPRGYGQGVAKLSYPLYATHMALLPVWCMVLPRTGMGVLPAVLTVAGVSILFARGVQAIIEAKLLRWPTMLRPVLSTGKETTGARTGGAMSRCHPAPPSPAEPAGISFVHDDRHAVALADVARGAAE